MNRTCLAMLIFALMLFSAHGMDWKATSGGQLAIIQSSHAPFPHPDRMDGHQYGDSLYSFAQHYNDSSVAIFIPRGFRQGRKTDLVFYFHGWGNNIQKSMEKFQLLEQFSASKKNAIFVFPQGPKNSKDSFGGRLEESGTFQALVLEILEKLEAEDLVCSSKVGDIVLAGHSGAYHVISAILSRGGLSAQVKEVYLFDALYGELEKFTHWLETYECRLVNIVTPNGGTLDNSLDLLDDLSDWGIPFAAYEQDLVSLDELKAEKVITVFTSLGHSEVIQPYFKRLLQSSGLGDL